MRAVPFGGVPPARVERWRGAVLIASERDLVALRYVLGSHAIHRIASMSSELETQQARASKGEKCLTLVLEEDRRFVQLTECAALQLAAFSPVDAARLLWG